MEVKYTDTMLSAVITLDSKIVDKFVLKPDITAVGRAKDNDIVINNPSVSRYHLFIQRKDGKVKLKDLGSGNGISGPGHQSGGPPEKPGKSGAAAFSVPGRPLPGDFGGARSVNESEGRWVSSTAALFVHLRDCSMGIYQPA